MTKEIQQINWYFDFISPFAYFQFCALESIKQQRPELDIQFTPVLFAGLLQHYGHKGPAEITSKRRMTYRYCHWYAQKNEIPFRIPAAHPFNPLAMLRLAIANSCEPAVMTKLFNHAWVDSAENPDFFQIEALGKIVGLETAVVQTWRADVKQQLRTNTEMAIERGVFGVPTLEIGDQLFWGLDMTGMAIDYLDNPEDLDSKEYQRIDSLPVAKAR